MNDYEKLGVFYLGRPYDITSKSAQEGLLLYKSRDLLTHGVCVGMTGSGKTGLCIALLEEAAIDGIPAIVIDPKGDMSNLLLTFPDLLPQDFRPWINEDDARRQNLSPDAYAQEQALLWKKGLSSWDQDGTRIRRLKDSAEFVVYTPGSTAGVPVSILKTLSAPSRTIVEDTELLAEQVSGAVSSLLGLVGIAGDPIISREHILISTILHNAWQKGADLDLPALIQQITNPSFNQIGVMGLESFFPEGDRFKLAIQFNSLLAAPGFAPWMEGEALNIDNILHTSSGKPRISIFSIAHLSDAERMFFVSLLLNQVLGWTRIQQGTTSLRAILYMDEISGYFPPVANPPSKPPLLTLLKQARAYGLGVLLATQNPVDLDYKGLSNTGTWFIGRLQTERDKARVLDGLEGAAGSQGMGFDRKKTEQIIAGLGQRVFLMNNVHDDAPTIFESRWAMSYLRGPLTRSQISQLMQGQKTYADTSFQTRTEEIKLRPQVQAKPTNVSSNLPVLPPEIQQAFLETSARAKELAYEPAVLVKGRVNFRDAKSKTDVSKDYVIAGSVEGVGSSIDWNTATDFIGSVPRLTQSPEPGAAFCPIPAAATVAKNYPAWARDFSDWLYRTQQIELMLSPTLKVYSEPGESERDFRVRLDKDFREKRDEALDLLRKKYQAKIDSAAARVQKAEDTVERKVSQAKQQQMQTAISVGATLLTSLLGSKKLGASTLGRATTAARGASRFSKDQGDVQRSQETVERYNRQLKELEQELQEETKKLAEELGPLNERFESHVIKPLKKDIFVENAMLVWVPVGKS